MIDIKSVKRFFEKKAVRPSLWNAYDEVLQFNFKRAHMASSVNTTAGFLSEQEVKVTEMIRLKIREDIQTIPIEVTTPSSDVDDGEQFSLTQIDNDNNSEEHTLQKKMQSRQVAKEMVANRETSSLRTTIKEFTKINGNSTSYSMHTNSATEQKEDSKMSI